MVRRDVVAAKLARARAWLNDAASALQSPLETFLSDPKSRDLSLFYLFLAIQECIDLAAHWVADEGWGDQTMRGRRSTCWPIVASSIAKRPRR